MAAGEVVDIVERFAGHIRLLQEVVLPRELYLDDALAPRPDDYLGRLRPDRGPVLDDEPFDTGRSPSVPVAGGPGPIPHFGPFHTPNGYVPDYKLPPLHPHAPTHVPPALAGGDGGGAPPPAFATYADGADDKILDLRQANLLTDNDVLVDHLGDVVVPPDVGPIMQALAARAGEEVPHDLRLPGDGSSIAAMLAHRDDLRAGSSDVHPNEVDAGHYRNGQLVPEGDGSPAAAAPAAGAPLPDAIVFGADATAAIDGHWRVGQEAVLGSNHATNAAAIVDTNELARAMIVGGNYYTTDAIIQTNVYRDIDTYLADGGPLRAGALSLVTGHDTATNDARFDYVQTSFSGGSGGGGVVNWHVDYVAHDFYDIKVVRQANVLSDNDFVSQTTHDVYSLVSTGENGQTNQLRLVDLAKHYDVIIIHGDYHGANIILQTNLLLDDDRITQTADDSGPSSDGMTRSVTSGDNVLQNEATIRHVGHAEFQRATSDVQAMMEQIRNHAETLDPNLPWRALAGSGDVNVLFVEGDYFDINLISQVNALSDKDALHQTTTSASGVASGGVNQDASTGGNVLKNAAGIVDVATLTGAQYIVGSHYHDTILVQANLVSDEHGVIYGDTRSLVPEAAAFVAADDAPDTHPTTTLAHSTASGDVLGHVLS